MFQANAESSDPVAETAQPPAETGAAQQERDSIWTLFKKRREDGEAAVSAEPPASQEAAAELQPVRFRPSAEALKSPEKMVEEFRALVEEDLEEGGSVEIEKEHAAAIAAYCKKMDREVARAEAGTETVPEAEDHMAILTREELVAILKSAGIGLLCLAI